MTNETLLYGEPSTEEDYLCDRHGCRLTIRKSKLVCSVCEDEYREEQEAMWREDCEEEMRLIEPMLPSSGCAMFRGKGFVGFQCTMPWWA